MRVARTIFLVALMAPSMALASGDKPPAESLQQLVTGARIYAENCAACHGAKLEGQPNWRQLNENGRLPAPPHNAKGHTWHHDDNTLFGITKLGTKEFTGLDVESDMPAFKDVLSDEEIWAVLAYIKSKWPERIRRQQEAINRRASTR